MNAFNFLGKNKIDEMLSQGYTPTQINDYARAEWQKHSASEIATPTENAQNNLNLNEANAPKQTEPAKDENFLSSWWNDFKNAPVWSGNFGGDPNYRPLTKEQEALNQKIYDAPKVYERAERDNDIKQEIANTINQKGAFRQIFADDASRAQTNAKIKEDLKNKFGVQAELGEDGAWYIFEKIGDKYEPRKLGEPNIINHIVSAPLETALPIAAAVATAPVSLPLAIGASAAAAGAGALGDQYINDQAQNMSQDELIKRVVEAVGVDTAASLLGAGAGKIAPYALKSAKATANAAGDLANKAWDNSGVSALLRHGATNNIIGAENALKNSLGEADALAAKQSAINALDDDIYTKFVNESKGATLPHVGQNETLNGAIDYANENVLQPISQTIKKILSDENINKREADLLLTALGDKNGEQGAKAIMDAVATDEKAFAKAGELFSNLNKSAKANLDETLKDTPLPNEVFHSLEKRAKDEYGQMVEAITKLTENNAQMPEIKRQLIGGISETLDGADRAVFTKLIKAISQNKGFDGLAQARGMVNQILHDTQAAPLTRPQIETYKTIRDLIDEASEKAVSATPQASELIKAAKADYRPFKELEENTFIKTLTKEGKSAEDFTNALLKANKAENGLDLGEILARLGERDRAQMENAIIKGVLEKHTARGVTDFRGVTSDLEGLPFESASARDIMSHLNESAGVLNNTSAILGQMREMLPKAKQYGTGIGWRLEGKAKVAMANKLVNKIRTLIPVVGNNAALRTHIANALKNAGGSLEVAAKNIRAIPTENAPTKTRELLNEVADVVENHKKIIEQNQKAAWQVADNPNLDKVDSLGGIGVIEDSGERVANALRSTPANENIIADKGLKLDNARARLIAEIDPATLNNEQRAIYDVLTGKKDRVILQGRDMSDLYELEQGSRHTAGRKIMIKHAGLEKTGGLDNRELLDMMRVVREGDTLPSSFQLYDNRLRYAYELEENGVKYRLVVDEYNDGRKVFDYYSDRNFIDDATDAKRQARAAQAEAKEQAKQAEAKAAKEYQRLSEDYDIEAFLRDRETVSAKDARNSQNLVSPREVREINKGEGYEREITGAVYSHNYNADFDTTKGDVARIRAALAKGQTPDPALVAKLKNDLDGAEYMGYEQYFTPKKAAARQAEKEALEKRLNENDLKAKDETNGSTNGANSERNAERERTRGIDKRDELATESIKGEAGKSNLKGDGKDYIRGDGFIMERNGKLEFTDEIKFELGEYLREHTDLGDDPIIASVNYLYHHHKEMFKKHHRREVIQTIKNLLDGKPEIARKQSDGSYYFANSLKHADTNNKSLMSDIVIEPQDGRNYVKHANKKKYSAEMRNAVEKELATDGESVKSSQPRQAAKTLDSSSPAPTRQEPAGVSSIANSVSISQSAKNVKSNLNEIETLADFEKRVKPIGERNIGTADKPVWEPIYAEAPRGWKRDDGATGYGGFEVFHNGKSRFGGERKEVRAVAHKTISMALRGGPRLKLNMSPKEVIQDNADEYTVVFDNGFVERHLGKTDVKELSNLKGGVNSNLDNVSKMWVNDNKYYAKYKDGEARQVTREEYEKWAEANDVIAFSHPTIGAGAAGGTMSGIETDEDGNITGFDPATFGVGFAAFATAGKFASKIESAKAKAKQIRLKKQGEDFAKFINRSLKFKNSREVFKFGEVSEKMAQKLKTLESADGRNLKREFNFKGYEIRAVADEIRHIKNHHPEDFAYLVKLPDIYENFNKATYNYFRNEKGQTQVAINLFKTENGKTLKAVELVDNGDKTLTLKTFFKPE